MRCDFCFRCCDIREGGRGWCGVRENTGGVIHSRYDHELVAIALDPVEKKPLYHFMPGTKTLSIAKAGCSYDCDFCQNAMIAREYEGVGMERWLPEEVVDMVCRHRIPSVSFTYTEPLVWQDYMSSVATGAKEKGLKTVMVSNGGFGKASLDRLLPLIDAFNIDIKGDSSFYRKVCHADLAPVEDGISAIASSGRHLEVTTMVIEGIHDEAMIASLGRLLHEAGVHVWHLTRFFPHRRMRDRAATGEACLARLYKVALESGVEHVYRGNSAFADPLVCHTCGSGVDRMSCTGHCPACGAPVYGVWA